MPTSSTFRFLLAGLCLSAACVADAGLFTDPPPEGYPELPVPPAPAFDVERTVPIALKSSSALKLGLDPSTIHIGSDGVVRYVAVLRNADGTASTALYQGIRCSSAEVKLYARHYADGTWRPVQNPVWQSLYDINGPNQYAMPIAKGGVCRDAAPNASAQQIVIDLKGDPLRYGP